MLNATFISAWKLYQWCICIYEEYFWFVGQAHFLNFRANTFRHSSCGNEKKEKKGTDSFILTTKAMPTQCYCWTVHAQLFRAQKRPARCNWSTECIHRDRLLLGALVSHQTILVELLLQVGLAQEYCTWLYKWCVARVCCAWAYCIS